MTDLQTGLRGSAETWRSTPPTPQVPEALLPPQERLSRHRGCGPGGSATCCGSGGRKSSSQTRASLTCGLPVADRRDVGAFTSRLLEQAALR